MHVFHASIELGSICEYALSGSCEYAMFDVMRVWLKFYASMYMYVSCEDV